MALTASSGSAPRLRLRVTAAAERKLRQGHPWLFSESVLRVSRPGALGELAVIYDRKDRFLAIGLYEPESPLRVRILHRGAPQAIDAAWWRARLQAAIERRQGRFDAATTGWRWIHGESDGWPGLVLDRYGETLVLKLYSAAWLPRLAALQELLASQLAAERLVLRLSRNIQETARRAFDRADGELLKGADPDAGGDGNGDGNGVVFLESGIRFHAEVRRGQKTGFYLDQRENRRLVESLASGREVLNAFSFSGGFSLYAARGGAKSVTDVDISEHALAAARRNFALNSDLPAVRACARRELQADVFEWIAAAEPRYDLIVLDPPTLARRESEREGAIQAYGRLARAAIARLRPCGLLVAASCSAHVSEAEFFGAVRHAAEGSGRAWSDLGCAGHALDHPVGFPEAAYLKRILLRVS